jgi:hypothetical protein
VSFGEPELDPFALDRVTVLDAHLRIPGGKVAQLRARFLGVVELRGKLTNNLLI